MKIIKIVGLLAVLGTAFTTSCSEDEVGPKLPNSEDFVAPVLTSPATVDPMVFTVDNMPEVYEVFTWEKPGYGVDLATNYVLQVDTAEDFSTAKVLATTSANSIEVTNDKLNSTMLSLGLPAFEESTVFLRLRSTIAGYAEDTLYSNSVQRTATTFQNSECGNFCTLGLIGSATPGGWDNDTDLRLADETRVDKSTWTAVIYLLDGQQVKFRAGDAWDFNWGGTDFPTGTGTPGGPDITVTGTGYYKVIFNDVTGEYTFTLLTTPVYASVGILGDATAGGWDNDTDLTQDANDPHVWTGTVTITDGEAKFRADNDWANSWGAATFPSGHGPSGGPNIPVAAGTYFVRFNDATGEYSFMSVDHSEPYATLGIIGDATPGGWDADTDFIKNPANPFLWSKVITLTGGESKFRVNDAWDVNWGATAFPGGIGAIGGPNIPTAEGTYFVTFNTGTGEYYFLK